MMAVSRTSIWSRNQGQYLSQQGVQVIKQFEQAGTHANRYDVTILVNGFTHYVGVKADITQRKQTEAKLRELSLTDELTGLTNRRGFTILAEQQIKLSQRLQQGFAIFFADMDGMKGINDQLGHAVGDQALQEMAKILKESFRASDIVARLGGDNLPA